MSYYDPRQDGTPPWLVPWLVLFLLLFALSTSARGQEAQNNVTLISNEWTRLSTSNLSSTKVPATKESFEDPYTQ